MKLTHYYPRMHPIQPRESSYRLRLKYRLNNVNYNCRPAKVIVADHTRDHLSVISGITPLGKLDMMVQKRPYKWPDVVNFLRHLLRHISGKLLVLWDGAPILRSKVIKAFLAEVAAARIQLERLPAYAPELNPDEGIWEYLKGLELKNLSCRVLSHLRQELRKATERLRQKTHIILGCIKQPGLV